MGSIQNAVKARFDFLYYSSHVVDTLHGEVGIYPSGIMVISIPTGGISPYLISGKKNEVGGWEGADPSAKAQAMWSEMIPGMYSGVWIEDGQRCLFQIET